MRKKDQAALRLSAAERRTVLVLALTFGLRMMGLFLILPVFALYAESLPEHTPMLVGLAIGIYGLTQAALQIPFGMLSDRIGRKPVIVGGLLLFAVGSLVAATADDLYGVILGRAMQGGGAIAAAIMALVADVTREEIRVRAMGSIGASIGLAFGLSLVLGPLLSRWIGVPGIFLLTALLSCAVIPLILLLVPTPARRHVHRDAGAVPHHFATVLRNDGLLRLDFGVLVLHMTLTALFLVFPARLVAMGLAPGDHWEFYLPMFAISVAAMIPGVILAEVKDQMRPMVLGSIAALGLAPLLIFWSADSWIWLMFAMVVYFTAFNVLEATQPSLVSKIAPADAKGTAMGFFTSSQFLGAFLGGLLGGWIQHRGGETWLFAFIGLSALAWLVVAARMLFPEHLSRRVLRLDPRVAKQELQEGLSAVPGVVEVVVLDEDHVAYLKVNRKLLDEAKLRRFMIGHG